MELNESSFAHADPASYTLEEFWPPGGLGDHLATARVSSSEQRTMTGVLTDSLGNLDEDSTVTHQSISCRKKRDSSIIIPITCGAQEKCNSSSKRAKVLDIKEVKRILKEEADDTCDTSGKKMAEASKQDFIHVRARRGQATDSHSLAERARREKISERMKVLQDLVPGCNKVIGKALVLDEIINYVLSLQHQVEFLSLKLEAINSNILPKDKMLPAKNLEMPGFDSAGMIFHTHPTSDYARGLQSKSLRMHLGENLE